MRSYFHINPWWLRRFYKKATYSIATKERVLFLTFDDGPTPEVTPWVMDLLDQYEAKATFFVVGKQAERYPELLKLIKRRGHTIGSHTYSHVSGWSTSSIDYLEEVQKCEQFVQESNAKLFRPPYGRIRQGQLRHLEKLGYQVVMWSHLAGDFDPLVNRKKSLMALKSAIPGSIILFHDSTKAFENLKQLLPRVLDHFSNLHFSFEAIK